MWQTSSQPLGAAPLDDKERAQDLGRRLMLDIGPLVGMVQIPGIKYGVKDVVTLSTLNSAIEDLLGDLCAVGINGLEAQANSSHSAWMLGSKQPGERRMLPSQNRLIPRMWLTRVGQSSRSLR